VNKITLVAPRSLWHFGP